MSQNFTIFVVDDAPYARVILESTFSKDYRVESFGTAEDCLARLNQEGVKPDLLLLDVDLPGMDGYTLCRKIKQVPKFETIPAIFISSLDDPESRLEGYDAGGIDYVVKPYNIAEIERKVSTARRVSAERNLLKVKMAESEQLSSLVLSNLDQYAALIQFLRSLSDCDTLPAVLKSLFDLMRSYQLNTAIQIRLTDTEMTVNEYGDSLPLELAVINNVRSMDRIFEFKSRAAYNFEHITILINNVPLNDPELCGQIRDNIAIAAESANSKLQALQTKAENTKVKGATADLLAELQSAVQSFEKKYSTARYLGSSETLTLLGKLSNAFVSLGMSFEQERGIESIVQDSANHLAEIYDFSGETQETLNGIADRLTGILNSVTDTAAQGRDVESVASQSVGTAIEMF